MAPYACRKTPVANLSKLKFDATNHAPSFCNRDESANVLDCYYCRPIFSWRNYKNKPLIASRIAEEKEKIVWKDLRRDTRRRHRALALAGYPARRNGLPIKGVELVFKILTMTNAAIWRSR